MSSFPYCAYINVFSSLKTEYSRQNYLLLNYLSALQNCHDRTGTRYIFFYISMFVLPVIIALSEYIFLCGVKFFYFEFQTG